MSLALCWAKERKGWLLLHRSRLCRDLEIFPNNPWRVRPFCPSNGLSILLHQWWTDGHLVVRVFSQGLRSCCGNASDCTQFLGTQEEKSKREFCKGWDWLDQGWKRKATKFLASSWVWDINEPVWMVVCLSCWFREKTKHFRGIVGLPHLCP